MNLFGFMEYTDYTGLVEYDGTHFKIVMGAGYSGTYDIASDRIMSGGGFLDFLLQLHSKKWATGQHIKDFLDCFEKWCVSEHGKYPQAFLDVIGGMNRGQDNPGTI